mmetsp:Transcript_40926/g.92105  ORF Transcript_40926/g.92105 Transcript_40926/m.92105 type:complete len:230 (+) Transcript_40926:517-1206(+)
MRRSRKLIAAPRQGRDASAACVEPSGRSPSSAMTLRAWATVSTRFSYALVRMALMSAPSTFAFLPKRSISWSRATKSKGACTFVWARGISLYGVPLCSKLTVHPSTSSPVRFTVTGVSTHTSFPFSATFTSIVHGPSRKMSRCTSYWGPKATSVEFASGFPAVDFCLSCARSRAPCDPVRVSSSPPTTLMHRPWAVSDRVARPSRWMYVVSSTWPFRSRSIGRSMLITV